MKNKKFQWSSIEARALGMIFTNNKTDIMKLNLEKKISQFETCLKQWQHRKLTLMGKVTVVKKFALPKLIFALSSLPNPPKSTIDRIEKIMYSFIWDSKPDKIKRSTLIQNYEKGGIRMINIEKFIMSLKVTWVKKILDSCNNGVLKKIYLKKLEKYGSALFFECNFDEKDIRTCFKNNLFLRDILLAWRKLNKKDAILCFGQEIIWNNTHIRANGKTIMYKTWYDLGIKKIRDIYDYNEKVFCSFGKLRDLYNIPSHDFLKYLSLIQCIPGNWKANLKHENRDYPGGENILQNLLKVKETNRYVYTMLLKKDEIETSNAEQKWNNHFSNENINWKKIYLINISTSKDMKLRDFQYRYLNRIVPTNKFLSKCQIVSSSLCDFCNMEIETMHHLFWECRYVQFFWKKFRDFFEANGFDISISELKITFGMQKTAEINANLKNFLIFTAKYFIFVCKYRKKLPIWDIFQLYLKKRVKIEREIALWKGRLHKYEQV